MLGGARVGNSAGSVSSVPSSTQRISVQILLCVLNDVHRRDVGMKSP